MDVICEQCKAEYDFDEALLGEKGTTVKCSRCAHVFRVAPPPREDTGRAGLQLRFASDGRVVPLASLRALQQRIGAGEVTRDDELGREGFPFRRLGEVPELKNFFGPPPGTAPRAAQRTVMGLGPAGAPSSGARKPADVGARAEAGEAPTLPATPAHVIRGESAPAPSSLPPPNARLSPANLTARGAVGAPLGPPAGHEHAPISTAPTRPATELPRAPAQPVPAHAGPAHAGPAQAGPATARPAAQPVPTMSESPRAPVNFELPPRAQVSAEPGAARAPGSGAPTAKAPVPVRGLALDTAEAMEGRPDTPRQAGNGGHTPMARDTHDRLERPGALAQALAQAGGGAPASSPAGASRSSMPRVKLRVGMGEDDNPSREREGGSSKLPYIAGGAVLLAAASWAGLSYMARVSPAEPEAQLAPAVDAGFAPGDAETTSALSDAAGADTGSALTATTPPEAPVSAKPTLPLQARPEAPARAEPAPAKPADKPGTRDAKPAGREAASEAKTDAKDYGGLVARGDQLFAKGDLPGAREAYTAAVAQRASGSEANSGLGFVLLAQGQYREAVPVLGRAAASGYAEASVGLGDAQRKLGNKDDAIEAYETYLARLPNGPRAKYAKAQLEALGSSAPAAGPRGARETEEPQNAPSNDFKPAGEDEAPAGRSNRTGSSADEGSMDEPRQ